MLNPKSKIENPLASPPGQAKSIGVLHHPKVPHSVEAADDIAAALRDWGAQAWRGSTWDKAAVEAQLPRLDLLVVLGGDGSLLRAARMAAPHGTLILGVNMGRLGFLTECGPDQWRAVLSQVMAGQYWVEQRLMLHAESFRGETLLGEHDALNDVVVSRGSLARVVRLQARIDGGDLTTYIADGLIAATATGSTAYALASGGPVLPPQLKNFLLIAIAPHLSLERAIVLDQGAVVEIGVHTDHQAILTVDGQFEFTLGDGDRVIVRAASHAARFARVQPKNYFYRTLAARLRFGEVE